MNSSTKRILRFKQCSDNILLRHMEGYQQEQVSLPRFSIKLLMMVGALKIWGMIKGFKFKDIYVKIILECLHFSDSIKLITWLSLSKSAWPCGNIGKQKFTKEKECHQVYESGCKAYRQGWKPCSFSLDWSDMKIIFIEEPSISGILCGALCLWFEPHPPPPIYLSKNPFLFL